MVTKTELIDWLQGLDENTSVGIDDGGLSLQASDGSYFEIGGVSEEFAFTIVNHETNKNHATYATLSEARGAVTFDGLTAYSIWCGNTLCECADPE